MIKPLHISATSPAPLFLPSIRAEHGSTGNTELTQPQACSKKSFSLPTAHDGVIECTPRPRHNTDFVWRKCSDKPPTTSSSSVTLCIYPSLTFRGDAISG